MKKESIQIEPFQDFMEEVIVLLESVAAEKRYNTKGINGPNPLYEFVSDTVDGPGHALGEIIYKVRRYSAKKDKKDLAKIAAWAYLVWRFDGEKPSSHIMHHGGGKTSAI